MAKTRFLKCRILAGMVALTAMIAAGSATAQSRSATATNAAPASADAERNDMLVGDVGQPLGADYDRRVVMIPMRDGVKLRTAITVPNGAHDAPMILQRTPYDVNQRGRRVNSPSMLAALPQADEVFARDGYIRVYQDIRGKYGSEGVYVMTRPPRGPLNPSTTDDTTDAYDTIDWLVKNVPESNGRVGMLGSSYDGWTVVMALLGPHPALKVAAPESPMIDGWMGDDWFHYGAYRQINMDYFTTQTSVRGDGVNVPRAMADDYAEFLAAGSAHDFAVGHGVERYPFFRLQEAHPAYDAFWSAQALDKLILSHPSHVPTMWEQGLWDQEDMWGAVHAWTALTKAGYGANNYLMMGPWRHSGANFDGSTLGPLHFNGDTGLQWRRDVLKPFFDQYLKTHGAKADTPRVFIYNTGDDHWDRLDHWPLACAKDCSTPLTPLYLQAGFGLGFQPPAGGAAPFDAYVADPARPVPYLPRPISLEDSARWMPWLVSDQRSVDGRTDVLVYKTPVLTSPVRISGAAIADLYAATTGTDGDWVVKLIDVQPDQVASRPELGGYELPIAMDIFRGRYRDSFEHPSAAIPNMVQRYRFALPTANHVFLPGHRIMVQIQSSWFPLYDRNPQTYVDNIFFATSADYVAATQKVYRSGAQASAIWLPIVPDR